MEDRERFAGALDVAIDLPLADLGSRGIAAMVDGLVLFLLIAAVAAAATLSAPFMPAEARGTLLVGTTIFMFLVQWGYFVAWELAWRGQSPGKRLMGLRVVTAEGAVVGPLASLLRNFLRIVDFMPGFYGVGVVVSFLSPRRRRLGDLAAGTLVVREVPQRAESVRIPEGFSAADGALIEGWFARVDWLEGDRRDILARDLVLWLRREHAELFRGQPTDLADEALLERLFRP